MSEAVPYAVDAASQRSTEVEYDTAEAKRAVRKVDFFLLPFIVLCFSMLQFVSACLGPKSAS